MDASGAGARAPHPPCEHDAPKVFTSSHTVTSVDTVTSGKGTMCYTLLTK